MSHVQTTSQRPAAFDMAYPLPPPPPQQLRQNAAHEPLWQLPSHSMNRTAHAQAPGGGPPSAQHRGPPGRARARDVRRDPFQAVDFKDRKHSRSRPAGSKRGKSRNGNGKRKHHGANKRASKLPPTCKLPDGSMFVLDSALRQGIVDCSLVDRPVFGTNVDILHAIEAHSPRAVAACDDVESGDEASCPEAPQHSSDGDSDDEDSYLPDNVKALLQSDKRQLALYTAHLEEQVCSLQKDVVEANARAAKVAGPTASV